MCAGRGGTRLELGDIGLGDSLGDGLSDGISDIGQAVSKVLQGYDWTLVPVTAR